MSVPASPSTDNYQVGKGAFYISEVSADGPWRHLGNVSEGEWTPSVDTLDHFSSQTGLKTKDKSVVVQTGATLRLVLDEITADNIKLLTLGTKTTESDGDEVVVSMQVSAISAYVKFEGANSVGQKVKFIGQVNIKPSGSFQFISDEWNTMELTADMVSHATYGLGQFTMVDPA